MVDFQRTVKDYIEITQFLLHIITIKSHNQPLKIEIKMAKSWQIVDVLLKLRFKMVLFSGLMHLVKL